MAPGPAMSINWRCISSGSSESASICSRVSTEPKRIAAPIGGASLRVLLHVDGFREVLDEQHDDVAIVALAHAHFLEHAGKKPGKLGARRIASRQQTSDRRQAVGRGLHRRGRRFSAWPGSGTEDGDRGVRNDGIRLIDDRNEHPRVTLLRRNRPCGKRRCDPEDRDVVAPLAQAVHDERPGRTGPPPRPALAPSSAPLPGGPPTGGPGR